MNSIKRFAALLLAMALLCCTAALAEGIGSITVENPQEGQTYTAYKIFDVEYNAGNTAYTYTIAADSPWLAVVQAYSGVTLSDEMTAADGTRFRIAATNDDFSAADFAAVLKENVEGKTGVALQLSGGKAVAEGLDLGYYFVTSTSGALCNLTTTDPDAVIHDKNDVPFDKVADDESVEVGQTVNYTINAKVPDTTGFASYVYEIRDVMSDGLTFNKDVEVKVNGTVVNVTPDYSVENGFVLSLDVKNMKAGDPIVVTYSAVVNEKAVAQIETNRATLTYSNNPQTGSTTTTPPVEEKVYTAKIVIDKHEDGKETVKLAGAKFVLMNAEDKFYSYANGAVAWVDSQADATVMVTDADGAAAFIGLENGDYRLKEIEAPAGYNLLATPINVKVNGSDADPASLSVTAKVANVSGVKLPETGGMGTKVLYVTGGALVIGAVVLLALKKRRDASR